MKWLKKLIGRQPEPEFDGNDFCETATGLSGQAAYFVRPCEPDEQFVIYSIYAGYDSKKIGTMEMREGGNPLRIYPIDTEKTVLFDPALHLDWGCALQVQLTPGGSEPTEQGERTVQSSITVHGCHIKRAT